MTARDLAESALHSLELEEAPAYAVGFALLDVADAIRESAAPALEDAANERGYTARLLGHQSPDPLVAAMHSHRRTWQRIDGTSHGIGYKAGVDVRPDGFVLIHEDVLAVLLADAGYAEVPKLTLADDGDPMPADLPDRILVRLRGLVDTVDPRRDAVDVARDALDIASTAVAEGIDEAQGYGEVERRECGAVPGSAYPPGYGACAVQLAPGLVRHDGQHRDAAGRTFTVSR